MADPEVVLRILADTSSAQQNVNQLASAMTKLAGPGLAGAAVGASLQAAMTQQDAMARIQTAYNSVDFAPGTQKYKDASDFIIEASTRLATNFNDLSTVYAQAARFVDDYGNKLPTDKAREYVEVMTDLSKISTDHLSAADIGPRIDIFEKLYGQTNFAQVGSAVSAESGIHNQGEGPMLDTANAIAQYGADMGVTQAQALGVGNYLTDLGVGGQRGGASIGRMLMRMDLSADAILDPEESYKQQKTQRDAAEKVDDLQNNLAVAEERRSEMYDSRGRLKRNYIRHPSEKMAADDRIARMHREISDAQADQAHAGDSKTPAGGMNLTAMAALVGEDPAQFASEFKDDPMGALLKWTGGVHGLDPSKREAAERIALGGTGRSQVKDLLTIKTMSDRPEVAQEYVDLAAGQLANPTDLPQRAAIPLSTTSAKAQDVLNAGNAALAAAGSQPRQAVDAGADALLAGIHGNTDILSKINDTLTGGSLFDHIVGGVVTGGAALLVGTVPSIIAGVLAGKAAAGAAGAAGTGATATSGASGVAASGGAATLGMAGKLGVAGGLAMPLAGLALGFQQAVDQRDEADRLLGSLSAADQTRVNASVKDKIQMYGQAGADVPPVVDLERQAIKEMHIPISVSVSGTNSQTVDVQAVANQAAQQVYAAIVAAASHSNNAPSRQLGGAY